ncbi:MAG TPA: hypothetical protein VMM83_00290 [Longimicrobiales bacterium]|nr:hypothetical protein [Longimicrobiales bacterium]
MRRTLIVVLGLAGLGGALAACGDEEPTGVGSSLLGPGIRTFEVILDAEDFLQGDTTYDNIGRLRDAGFRIVANQFAGELDAHTLFRISRPFTVTWQTEDGTARTDSLRAIRGARVTLILDTVASTPGPVDVEVLPVTESWDPGTVSWTLRHDTAGVAEPWTTPGGTTGPAAGSAIWLGGDTLVIAIDSADAAVWQDTAAARRGALIRPVTTGARLRIRLIGFEFDVVPEAEVDTVLTAGGSGQNMHIATPAAPAATQDELRVGGLPTWRTLLHFKPLRDLVLDACDGGLGTGDPECDVPLRDVSLNLAALLLDPSPVGGHRVEGPIRIEGRPVLEAENVSVFRSPLTGPLDQMQDSIPPELFTPTPPPGVAVSVPVTSYIRDLLEPEADGEEKVADALWLALVATVERATFGYAAFSSLESTAPPRLRLVVSLPNREIFE